MVKILFLLFFLIELSSSTYDLKKERIALLNLHNIVRNLHHVSNLTQSSYIEKIAQKYSDFLLKNPNKYTELSKNTYNDSKLGENIYVGKNTENFSFNAIQTWYKESEFYFNNPEHFYFSPHFTQLVWKSTKLLGCGLSCNTENCYLVCNYYPTGNVLNEYYNNVFPIQAIKKEEKSENLVEDVSESNEPLEKFRNEITERHNYYRKEHYVGELQRDPELEKLAQDVAEYMSEIDSIYYNYEKYNEQTISKNFFYDNNFLDGEEVADEWYSQIKNYDFKNPATKKISLIKDFSNLIWKKTKKIGCGYSCKNEDKKCYYCCAYYPGGIESALMDNILPVA